MLSREFRAAVALLCVLIGATRAQAQMVSCETACHATAGEAIAVIGNALDSAVTYRLTVNGAPEAWPLTTEAGAITFTLATGLPVGAYVFVVTALDGTNRLIGDGHNTLTVDPIPVEDCGADGYGNGVDDDGDGVIDEACALPPPVPPPSPLPTCLTDGVLYAQGAQISETLPRHQARRYIAARSAEGWMVIGEITVKNRVIVTLVCWGR